MAFGNNCTQSLFVFVSGETAPQEQQENSVEWLSSEKVEVLPSHIQLMLSLQGFLTRTIILNFSLAHLTTDCVVSCIKKKSSASSCIRLAEDLHSDLVTAKYEGMMYVC